MELGVALSGYKEVIESAYDLPAISGAADFMSVMAYDYHGGWETTTSHHTPIIPYKRDALAHYSIVSQIIKRNVSQYVNVTSSVSESYIVH